MNESFGEKSRVLEVNKKNGNIFRTFNILNNSSEGFSPQIYIV